MKKYSYEILVVALTIVLPIICSLIQTFFQAPVISIEGFLFGLGMWAIFWGVGVRLLIAGISQSMRPEFTSKTILGIKTNDANQVVRELGFANFSMGLVGVASLWFYSWAPAVGLIGGIFLGLDGIEHIRKKNRNVKENVALVTDLFVAIAAISYSIAFTVILL